MHSPIRTRWQKLGGSSLLLSITVHSAILLVMGLVWMKRDVFREQVDFIPAGRSETTKQAHDDLKHRKRQNAVKTLAKKAPKARLVIAEAKPEHLPAPNGSGSHLRFQSGHR